MLALWKESYDKAREHVKKHRHHFVTKISIVKIMVFPTVMYRCESWTIKMAECWRMHAFELWCWRRLLRVPWTARRSNQSILKEINPEYSLERLMLKLTLATWCEEPSLEKDPDAGKGWRQKGKWTAEDEMGRQHHCLNAHDSEKTPGDSEGQRNLVCYSLWGCKESDRTSWLNNKCQKTQKVVFSLGRWGAGADVHCLGRKCINTNFSLDVISRWALLST